MPLYCSLTWSNAVPWSVIRRVKMSSRPVELFGLARRGAMGQVQRFEQRHDVDAALLEYAAGGQVHRCIARSSSCLGRALAGQEAGAHAVRHRAEAQVEAGRLDLVVADRLEGEDLLAQDHRAQVLARHDAGRVRARRVVGGLAAARGRGGGWNSSEALSGGRGTWRGEKRGRRARAGGLGERRRQATLPRAPRSRKNAMVRLSRFQAMPFRNAAR